MVGNVVRLIALVSLCLSSARALADESSQTVEDLRQTLDQLRQQLESVQQRLKAIEAEQQRAAPQAAPATSPAPATAAAPSPAPKSGELQVYWDKGIHLDSVKPDAQTEKPFQLRLLGTIQADAGWFRADDDVRRVADPEDGVEFRRARIGIGGTIYTDYEFLAVYDFADGPAEFKDVYVGAKNIPVVGTLRVGHFTEYASLDLITSDNDTVFLERALTGVLVPARNFGIGAQNAFFDGRMTAALGVFRDADDFGRSNGGADNYAVTARVTGLPWQEKDGAHYLHLGAWTSARNGDIENYRIRQRPEAHLSPYLIDSFGEIGAVDSTWLYGGEAAVVFGPFSAQGEYMQHRLNRDDGPDVTMQGEYVIVRYILTGEHRTYRPDRGVFDRVVPDRNFQISSDGGPGAWELALRYSHLDLQDRDVDGGTQDDLTAGLNWYLNPNMKVMFNYVHGWIDRDATITFLNNTYPPVDGTVDAFLTRFQVTW